MLYAKTKTIPTPTWSHGDAANTMRYEGDKSWVMEDDVEKKPF